jgi:MarR family transcriptional regulator for hemolysin
MERNERYQIGLLIHDVSRLRRTAFDHLLRPLRITRSQWWVLTGVSRHGSAGITQTELARLLSLGTVALGSLIDRLEIRHYVSRRTHPTDRRTTIIRLTPKGSAILELTTAIAVSENSKVMKGISMWRQRELAAIFDQMKLNLIALEAVPQSRSIRKRDRLNGLSSASSAGSHDAYIRDHFADEPRKT